MEYGSNEVAKLYKILNDGTIYFEDKTLQMIYEHTVVMNDIYGNRLDGIRDVMVDLKY